MCREEVYLLASPWRSSSSFFASAAEFGLRPYAFMISSARQSSAVRLLLNVFW